MKIAVFYSGMFRNFIDNIDNHKENVLSLYDCDVYFHFWDVYGTYIHFDRSTNVPQAGITPPTFYTNYVTEKDKQTAISQLNPVAYVFEPYAPMEPVFQEMVMRSGRTDKGPPNILNLASMHYKIYKGFELIKETGKHYDIIVKTRTDLTFSTPFILEDIMPNTIYGTESHSWNEDTLSDLFFYGDFSSMDLAHNIYHNLENMWDRYNPSLAPEYIFPTFIRNNGYRTIKSGKTIIVNPITGR